MSNDIEHILSPPWHPQSNGAAERQVGVVKQNLRKYLLESKSSKLSVECQLQNFLFKSHNTPLSDNICPPGKIFKYEPRTNVSHFLKEKWTLASQVGVRGETQVQFPTKQPKNYQLGEKVYVWYPRSDNNYIEGEILSRVSTLIYKIKLKNGHVMSAHVDSIKKCTDPPLFYSNEQVNDQCLGDTGRPNLRRNRRSCYKEFFGRRN